jgi:hypothetical protein
MQNASLAQGRFGLSQDGNRVGTVHARNIALRLPQREGLKRPPGRPLLLQHHLAVGVFETLEAGEEGEAEQVLGQRLVGQHHGVDVAHD